MSRMARDKQWVIPHAKITVDREQPPLGKE